MPTFPALAETLDILLPKLSFLSVGTNDLTQFLFAADRANPKLAERYDWLSPAILRFLARVTQSTAGSGIDLGICGEMGGRRLEALALLGLGFRRFSITPVSVGPIKELVRKGFYNGTPIHRVIPGFMAQMGDPTGTGGGPGSGTTVPAEFGSVPFERGTVGLARTEDPNSGDSQFFIMFAANDYLNGKYTAFGKVIAGMDVVDKIKAGTREENGMVKNPDKLIKAALGDMQ